MQGAVDASSGWNQQVLALGGTVFSPSYANVPGGAMRVGPGRRRIGPFRHTTGWSMKAFVPMGLVLALLAAPAHSASGINGINSGMPNRISMNMTVPKQTQGATFGEKVNAGLHAAGGALSQGASLRIDIACDGRTCLIAFPDGQAVRADLQAMTLTPVDGQVAPPAALQGVVPGAGIVSAAVSSVSALGGATGGAAAASYAARGRMAGTPAALPARTVAPDRIDVTQPLADGDYQLSLVVEKATSGLKDTLKTQVRTMAMAPARVRIELAFQVQDGVLHTRHETAKNSISNIR